MTDDRTTYARTRFLILRLLGLVYAVAFLILVQQLDPLIGSDGLLPAAPFLAQVRAAVGLDAGGRRSRLPTLFWLDGSDAALHVAAWTGLALSVAVAARRDQRAAPARAVGALPVVRPVGQLFYGYGWETQLLRDRRSSPSSSARCAASGRSRAARRRWW